MTSGIYGSELQPSLRDYCTCPAPDPTLKRWAIFRGSFRDKVRVQIVGSCSKPTTRTGQEGGENSRYPLLSRSPKVSAELDWIRCETIINNVSQVSTKTKTATIRELRTNFRSVKRRIEEHGEIVITDLGEPAYTIKPVRQKAKPKTALPDYYSRLLRRQPKPLSFEETRRFWDAERR
jgi:antitoxin (DNA-binding transcriptional repressor) of toxin-antitoxin stability system